MELFKKLGVFVLGRTHITSLLYGLPFRAHGVPSPMWGGSVFDLVIIFQKTAGVLSVLPGSGQLDYRRSKKAQRELLFSTVQLS